MDNELIAAVVAESNRAIAEHGLLTGDHFHALAIMVEEVGEVGKALLDLRRAIRVSSTVPTPLSSGYVRYLQSLAKQELVQVISVASLMIENLEKEQ